MKEADAHPGIRRVLLLRHPETDWNVARRYQGSTDRPWSAAGEERARRLAHKYRTTRFDLIISSPRSHARDLATTFHTEGSGLVEDSRWAEIDHGRWEGLTHEEVSSHFGDAWKERFSSPQSSRTHGGESLGDLVARVEQAWITLLEEMPAPSDILVVSHATPIQTVLCLLTGVPLDRYWRFRIDCGSETSVELTSEGAIINYCNRK